MSSPDTRAKSVEKRSSTGSGDEATERGIVADQLRQIALLRLAGAVAP